MLAIWPARQQHNASRWWMASKLDRNRKHSLSTAAHARGICASIRGRVGRPRGSRTIRSVFTTSPFILCTYRSLLN